MRAAPACHCSAEGHMKVVYRLEDLPPDSPGAVATIGNFDGIHLGHRRLLLDLAARARQVQGIPTVVTFQPHPLQVLAPNNAPRQIQTLDQKLAELAKLGMEQVIVIPFTREFAQTSARDFVVKILWEKAHVREIYVGPNFAFGHRREGSFSLLKEIGLELGFLAGRIHQVHFRGNRVSSTSVRQALLAGQVSLARRLLGRPFALEGEIVHGAAIGAGLSIPTANLCTRNEIIPHRGVYASWLSILGYRYRGVTNIGVRPTVSAGDSAPETTIETHLLDFKGDLYGRDVSLELLLYLRPEKRFESTQALVDQIRRDVARARRYFRCFEIAAPSEWTENLKNG